MQLLQALFSRGRISWRRLACFLVATGLLLSGNITEETWRWVALAYIGSELTQRVAEAQPATTPGGEP